MGNSNRDQSKLWVVVGLFISLFTFACASGEISQKKELSRTQKARLLVEIANGALLEGDSTGALQSLAKAELEDNQLPELYHSKALAYYAKGNFKNAIEAAEKSVAIKPDYPDASNTLGRIYLETGQYQKAISPLQAAAHNSLYRDAYKAWTNLGILEYRRNELKVSLNYLDHAIQESPQQACIAYYYRGHIQLKSRFYQNAIKDYISATKNVCASFNDAWFALGVAYQQNKQYDLARKTFIEIQKLYPNTRVAQQAVHQLKYLP